MNQRTFHPYAFDRPFDLLLRPLGVAEDDGVTLSADRFHASFGRWSVDTSLSNISKASVTGPYRWFKAIGLRGSMADQGLTMGTTASGGVCISFLDPIPAVIGAKSHTALTVTVADPDALFEDLCRRGVLEVDSDRTKAVQQ